MVCTAASSVLLACAAPKGQERYVSPTQGDVSTVIFANASQLMSLIQIFPNKECLGPKLANYPGTYDARGDLAVKVPRNSWVSFHWHHSGAGTWNQGTYCEVAFTFRPTEDKYLIVAESEGGRCTLAAARLVDETPHPLGDKEAFIQRNYRLPMWSAKDPYCEPIKE